MTIGIRYCGGCNPRFDRAEIASRLKKEFPQHDVRIHPDTDTDAVVILCGCSAACADVTAGYGVYGRFVLWEPSAWNDLKIFITSMDEEMRNHI